MAMTQFFFESEYLRGNTYVDVILPDLYGKRNKVTVRSNHALLKKDTEPMAMPPIGREEPALSIMPAKEM